MDSTRPAQPVLYVVVPCYNEETVLPVTKGLFQDEIAKLVHDGRIAADSKVLFVNDGSGDRTWEIIQDLASTEAVFEGVSLSRNRGHQNALLAGLSEAVRFCDVAISIDCDGQDDVAAMEAMLDEYADGCDVVYGVRSSRATDSLFKRTTAQGFYRVMNKMGASTVYNHADYRLLSKRVIQELLRFEEVNLFLRGMVPLIGFKSTSVYYERRERIAGASHYPLKKMIGLALDGITSLSIKPIRMIAGMGVVLSLLSVVGIVWAVVTMLQGNSVAGWASIVCIVCFIGGIQLISLGVIGEYVGKTYLEAKRRPRFIVERTTYEGAEHGSGR